MVNLERSDIFPLSVAGMLTMPDRYPVTFAHGLAVTDKRVLEQWDNPSSLWFGVVIIDTIIRQSHINRVLPGCEAGRDKICSLCRVILAAVVAYPTYVPGTLRIRSRIVFDRLLSNPKNGCSNLVFSGVMPMRWSSASYYPNLATLFSRNRSLSRHRERKVISSEQNTALGCFY
jgi:hypothetical protein